MALKGHTTIELFDAKSGELVEKREDDNMITNFPRDLFTNQFPRMFYTTIGEAYDRTGNTSYSIKNLFGGIECFDHTLNEDADDYKQNLDGGVTSFAADYTYSGDYLLAGSYNSNLSSKTSSEFKLVWDWGAEQGNGTISSVGLLSANGGRAAVGRDTDFSTSTTGYLGHCVLCSTSRDITYFKSSSNTTWKGLYLSKKKGYICGYRSISTSSIVLWKASLPKTTIDIFSEPTFQVTSSDSYVYTSNTTVTLTGITASNPILTTDKNYLYVFNLNWSGGTVAPSGTVNYTKINLDDYTTSTGSFTNTTGVYIRGNIQTSISSGLTEGGRLWGIVGGYLIVPCSTASNAAATMLYAINLTNNADVHKFTTVSGENPTITGSWTVVFGNFLNTIDDKYIVFSRDTSNYHNTSYRSYILSVKDFVVRYTNDVGEAGICGVRNSNVYATFLDNDCDDFIVTSLYTTSNSSISSAYIYITIYDRFLMTINNLSTPVTKTADKTMRITYTLTKATEA